MRVMTVCHRLNPSGTDILRHEHTFESYCVLLCILGLDRGCLVRWQQHRLRSTITCACGSGATRNWFGSEGTLQRSGPCPEECKRSRNRQAAEVSRGHVAGALCDELRPAANCG